VPFRLIKYDVESDSHIRTSDGFCIECPVGEVGEGIGRIDNDPNKISGTLIPHCPPSSLLRRLALN
jgi:fatty-acyl-CoA synthase